MALDHDKPNQLWNDLIPVQTFWQMKAQLDAQDRELAAVKDELKEIKADIRLLLAMLNKSKGGWYVLLILGSVGGFCIDIVVRRLWGE